MACTCNLALIDKECGRNAPGMQTIIYLACADDITSIGAATGHAVSTITMVALKKFFPINITRKDSDLKVTPGEDGGHTSELKGFISKQSAVKAAILTNLATDENYVALAVDQNGYVEILGSLAHPVKAKVEATKTPKNGYTLTITWDGHADLPYSFTGTISTLI